MKLCDESEAGDTRSAQESTSEDAGSESGCGQSLESSHDPEGEGGGGVK